MALPPADIPLGAVGWFTTRDVERIDVLGGTVVSYELSAAETAPPDAMDQVARTLRRRLDAMDIDGSLEVHGHRVLVALPGLTGGPDTELARDAAFRMALVDAEHPVLRQLAPAAEVEVDVDTWDARYSGRVYQMPYARASTRELLVDYVRAYPVGDDREWAFERVDGYGDVPAHWRTYVVRTDVGLGPGSVAGATVVEDQRTGRPEVDVEFDDASGRAFEQLTRSHAGDKLAILLRGDVASAPVIMEAIPGGHARITLGAAGSRDELEAEARALALDLRAGSLPAPLREVDRMHWPASWRPVFFARLTIALAIGLAAFGLAWLVASRLRARV